jgi:ribosome-binding factor A
MLHVMAEIIRTVKDPRVNSADVFIGITGVDCSADLKFAKVFYSVLGKDFLPADVKKGLVSASGYIRSQLAEKLNLRITPELKFYPDTSAETGMTINKLIRQIENSAANSDDDENGVADVNKPTSES